MGAKSTVYWLFRQEGGFTHVRDALVVNDIYRFKVGKHKSIPNAKI